MQDTRIAIVLRWSN